MLLFAPMKPVVPISCVLALLCSGISVRALPVQLPSNGHYYDLILDEGNQWSWQDALDMAASMTYKGMQGHLATLATEAEHLFISDTWTDRPLFYYIGGFQDPATTDPTANWNWITGEAWGFTGWGSGEPNDYKGVDENRLSVIPRVFGWNDAPSTWNHNYGGFFIEYQPSTSVPEGGAGVLGLATLVGLLVAGRRWGA
jgi:hypothetical protein